MAEGPKMKMLLKKLVALILVPTLLWVWCLTLVKLFKLLSNMLFLVIHCFLFSLVDITLSSNLHLWSTPSNLGHLYHFQ